MLTASIPETHVAQVADMVRIIQPTSQSKRMRRLSWKVLEVGGTTVGGFYFGGVLGGIPGAIIGSIIGFAASTNLGRIFYTLKK